MTPGLKTSLSVIALLAATALPVNADASHREVVRHSDDERPMAVKAARIWTLDADEPLRDAWMEIAAGKIVRLGSGAIPSDLDVVDLGDVTLIPGLVAMNSVEGAILDPGRSGAGYVAADNFDGFARQDARWSKGITTARVGVNDRTFVGGIASVIKLGGPERTEILERFQDLAIDFTDEGGRNAPAAGEIAMPSSSDVPMVPGVPQRPKTRLGRIVALTEFLAAGQAYGAAATKPWREAPPVDPRFEALAEAIAARTDALPLRIEARRAVELRQAIEASRRFDRPAYVYGADEAELVLADLLTSRLGVVFEVDPFAAPASDAVDTVTPLRPDRTFVQHWLAAKRSLALVERNDDLLLAAAHVGGNRRLGVAAALKTVTLNAAELLGIQRRVGSLSAGKDADFVVLNGEPLSSRTHATETWVGGRRVWQRRGRGDAVVIRAGKVYDGKGGTIHQGEVLIEGGKIVAVGTQVGRPPAARIIDAGPRSVVTPGFIDAHGHAGLYGDRARLTAGLTPGDAVSVARTEVQELARAGVTTVVLATRDADPNGSPVSAVKTFGIGADEVVADRLAALKLGVPRDGEATEKALDGLLKRAKAYDELWRKYEEELAKWKAAGATASSTVEPTAVAEAKPDDKPAKDDPITGTWEATLKAAMLPEPEKSTFKLKLNDDGTIVGSASSSLSPDGLEMKLSGRLNGKTVTLDLELPPGPMPIPVGSAKITATLDGPDHMTGKLELGGLLTLDLEAVRTERGAPVIKVSKTTKKEAGTGPKKPKLDQAMEPFREVLAGRIGLMVSATSPTQVRAVIKVLSPYKIKPLLLGAELLPADMLAEIKDAVSVALPMAQTHRVVKRRQVVVAEEFDRAGIQVSFRSDSEAAAAGLPDFVRRAVRQGFGADAALQALTWNAASALHLEDTVGSLTRGCDGDVLIFDGEPFEAGTKLTRVFVRGKEVTP